LRQFAAACSRSLAVICTLTSFSASAKVAGETSGPYAGAVPNAGGAPGGVCDGAVRVVDNPFGVRSVLRQAAAAAVRPRHAGVKNGLRELGMAASRRIVTIFLRAVIHLQIAWIYRESRLNSPLSVPISRRTEMPRQRPIRRLT